MTVQKIPLSISFTEIKNDELNALIKKIPSDKKSQQYGQWAVKIRNVAKAFPREENRETNSSVRALVIIADYLSVSASYFLPFEASVFNSHPFV